MGTDTHELRETLQELEEVEWELECRGRAPPNFGAWIARARPEWRWDARHFVRMQETLDRITSGELRRVIFQIPIRHGKSEHNTSGFLTYHFERNPRFRGLLGTYNQRQADKFSRGVRRLVRSRGVALSLERDAASEWETAAGGGLRAVGAGAGVASVNADGIMLDDPIGSRDEAESPAHRDRVFDWITNDILARTEPHTWVILTMSRWHQDDPIGRLLDQQKGLWHLVDLPALAEKDDPLGRAVDEPLWPEERSRAWLDEKRAELGAYGFASLLQLRPRPRLGGMFQWDWWKHLKAVPASGPMVRYWDPAGTEARGGDHDPDFTAGALLCRMENEQTAIVDVKRFRKSVAARDARMREVCRSDLARFPGRVAWWIETESGIAGKERTEALVRSLQAMGMPVYTEHPTGSKINRAEPLASKAEAGNVYLCPDDPVEPWHDAFRNEAADFPQGTHDDQIDGAAGADAKLGVMQPWTQTRVTY